MERRFVVFTDFNKVFNNKKNDPVQIPEIILQQLNKPLKNGLRYIDNGNGTCSIVSDSEMKIGGIEIIIDEEMKRYIGEKISQSDILEYSYNTQRPLHLKMKKQGVLQINDQEVPIEKVNFNPYKNVKYSNGEMIAVPEPMEEVLNITLSDNEYKFQTSIHRIPCYKKNCIAWKTDDDSKIFIKIEIDIKAHTMNCDLKLSLNNEKCVKEIVRCMSIFYALATGKGSINGVNIKLFEGKKEFKFDKIILDYWSKVLSIEKEINRTFKVIRDEMEDDDVIVVEKLFQMLVNKNPIRSSDTLNSLNCSILMKEGHTMDDVKKGKGTFVFESTHMFELFGEKIELPSITVMNDVVISEIKQKGHQQELIIDNSETKAYYSELVFKAEEDRCAYKVTDNMEAFISAKLITYYMKNL